MNEARIARIGAAVAAAALALTALAGCTSTAPGAGTATPATQAPAATKYPFATTDDAGRSVTINASPKRIVSLAPANTEIVYALGAFDRLVGVTTYDDYPTKVSEVAKMGDFTTPNLEAIAAAKPDLILVTGGVQADVIGKLEGLGAAVLVVDPKDLAGVKRAVVLVADALDLHDKGRDVTSDMDAKIDAVKKAVAGTEPVTCFVEIGWNPLFTVGKGTLLDDLVTVAGGKNVVAQDGYVGYSVEQLLKDQPRVYLGTSSSLTDAATVDQRPGYKRLAPVISGRVVVLDDNLVSRPGPRIVDGLTAIARALHPDKF